MSLLSEVQVPMVVIDGGLVWVLESLKLAMGLKQCVPCPLIIQSSRSSWCPLSNAVRKTSIWDDSPSLKPSLYPLSRALSQSLSTNFLYDSLPCSYPSSKVRSHKRVRFSPSGKI